MNGQRKKRERSERVASLLMLLLLLAAGWSLYPAEQRGANVLVWTINNEFCKGELLKVSAKGLILFDHDTQKEIQLEISNISSITIMKQRKRSAILQSMISGGMLGGIAPTGRSLDPVSTNFDDDIMYTFYRVVCIGLGVASGAIVDLVINSKKTSKSYSLDRTDELQKKQILDSMQPYSRENYDTAKQQRKLLDRFRLSWLPFLHPLNDINFSGKINKDPSASNWKNFTLDETYTSHANGQCLRFQINYALSKLISAGIDFASLGERDYNAMFYQNYEFYPPGTVYINVYNKLKVTAAMLNFQYTPISKEGRPSGLAIELGLGPTWNNLRIDTKKYPSTLLPQCTTAAASWTSLAYKIGATWEFYPSRPFSLGLYCHYLHIPTTTPSMEISIPNIYDTSFQPSLPVVIPSQRINLGGVIIGALVRFR